MTHSIPLPSHHPSNELLCAYASGSLDQPVRLLIATHLGFCRKCQRLVRGVEELAGSVFATATTETVSDSLLNDCLTKISRLGTPVVQNTSEKTSETSVLSTQAYDKDIPLPLKSKLPDKLEALPWHKLLNKNVREYRLGYEDGWRYGLIHMKAKEKLPRHSHRGIEATLVLRGQFMDEEGLYQPGDFVMCDQTNTHQPHIGSDDCLCLYALNAPLQFKGALMRFVNPFLRI